VPVPRNLFALIIAGWCSSSKTAFLFALFLFANTTKTMRWEENLKISFNPLYDAFLKRRGIYETLPNQKGR